jgi:uncharacterized protein YndB with AHSA1/START domain
MLKKILIGVAVLIVLLVAVVAMQSSDLKVSRSTTIKAPPETVFEQVNDLHKFQAWNPWAKIDPNMKQTFEGPEAGVGSKYTWVGNNEVGEGRMTIVKSEPAKLVDIDLEFFKPMAGRNLAEFTFTPDKDGTVVTWTMTGKKNFMAKAFGLLVSMDTMIGGMFEKGLASMKEISEAAAGKPAVAEPQA